MPFSESPCCAPSRQQLARGDRFRIRHVQPQHIVLSHGESWYDCLPQTFSKPVLASARVPSNIKKEHGFNRKEEVLLQCTPSGIFQATRVRDGQVVEIDDCWWNTHVEVLDAQPLHELVNSAVAPVNTIAPKAAGPVETAQQEEKALVAV